MTLFPRIAAEAGAPTPAAVSPQGQAALAEYWQRHFGEPVVVCGCGRSLVDLALPAGVTSIGVNDVGRHFDPTYLVVANRESQFTADRWTSIRDSAAQAVFSPFELALPRLVHFDLGQRGGTHLSRDGGLHYTSNSPYIAVCLAAYMGASRIGLIGVDFTDHHFFADTGVHALNSQLETIDAEFGRLAANLATLGVELVNLSPSSRLQSLPRRTLHELLGQAAPAATPHIDRFIQALRRSLLDLGMPAGPTASVVGRKFRGVQIVWNRSTEGRAERTLICEHGWLPRSSFQVSWRGINADSHHAPFRSRPLSDALRDALRQRLSSLRAAERAASGFAAVSGLPPDFLLVPLQIESDSNLLHHAPPGLRRQQQLVDAVSAADPPWPIVFKKHPSALSTSIAPPKLRRPQDRLHAHALGGVHALFDHGGCRGVVAVNSNVVNDALLWDVPAVALGRGIWSGTSSPFLDALPTDWSALQQWQQHPEARELRLAYVHFLFSVQWTLEDAQDRLRVARLAAQMPWEAPAKPYPARGSSSRASKLVPPGPLPRINLVLGAQSIHSERLRTQAIDWARGTAVCIVSETPTTDADAWVFWQAADVLSSPNPAASVCFVHDLVIGNDENAAAVCETITQSAALMLSHPALRQRLVERGVGLSQIRLREAMPGAPESFGQCNGLDVTSTDTAPTDTFVVAWRAVASSSGPSCSQWLQEAVASLRSGRSERRHVGIGFGLDALQLDPCMPGSAGECLASASPETASLNGVDCVVVGGDPARRPSALFEAMACGLPVIAVRSDWSEAVIDDGENGYLIDMPSEVGPALDSVERHLVEWRRRRGALARSVSLQSLESWLVSGLDLALNVKHQRDFVEEQRKRPPPARFRQPRTAWEDEGAGMLPPPGCGAAMAQSIVAAGSEKPFLFVPWGALHGDALMRLLDPGRTLLQPFHLSGDHSRGWVNMFVNSRPETFRHGMVSELAALKGRIRGVVLTLDWMPFLRLVAQACRAAGVPTVLIPHEGVFASRSLYYRHEHTRADYPVCDLVLCWGRLQRDVFAERGYPPERLRVVGSPKIDAARDYRAQLGREAFCRLFDLDAGRPIVLFAVQLLDIQFADDARHAQRLAVKDTADACGRLGCQLIVRMPPGGGDPLGHEARQSLLARNGVVVDDGRQFRASPAESLAHCRAVVALNSTMLIEGALMGVPPISARYTPFEPMWEAAEVAAATCGREIAELLEQALAGRLPALSEAGERWVAEHLSLGASMGGSAERIMAELRALPTERTWAMAPSQFHEHLFADQVQDVHFGSAGLVGPAPHAPHMLAAWLGFRQVIAEAGPHVNPVADVFLTWPGSYESALLQRHADSHLGRPLLSAVDGQLCRFGRRLALHEPRAIVLDCGGPRDDARAPTRFVARLSGPYEPTQAQRQRAARCISRLRCRWRPVRPRVHTGGPVLLMDQAAEDADVVTTANFERMLAFARDELPPDVPLWIWAPTADGVLARLMRHAGLDPRRVRWYGAELDPYTMLEPVERVLVVTSAFGFEALLAGVPVDCFGAPFFAGWGLTGDHDIGIARLRQRSIEDVFHVVCVEASRYGSTEHGGRPIELEDYLDAFVGPEADRIADPVRPTAAKLASD